MSFILTIKAKITTESNNEDNKWVKSKVIENKSIGELQGRRGRVVQHYQV